MRPFEALSYRGQIGRLRLLAETALASYRIRPAKLVPLAHMENTTFRVDTPSGDRYVLRIHRTTGSPVHPPRSLTEVSSEIMWLSALRRETELAAPEPVPAADGSLVTVADVESVPESRNCVLFQWGQGKFLDAGLTPSQLSLVGEYIARLHDHATYFKPPPNFKRWNVADLSGDAADYVADLVGELCGSEAVSIVEVIMHMARQAKRELGEGPGVFGLIHADLHQENFLFDRGQVRAIDFDDCGWGHFAYDLAVTLSELRWKTDYAVLRAGLLRGYRSVRPLPVEHERYIEVFSGLRLLLLTCWFLEQRDHPAFPDWEREAREGLAELELLANQFAASA
jgi:Ser/Thr protein kinase RdoA (MazF antagonist)